MENSGFIKLHRKMLEWEWYSDNNTKILFLHCLLKASYKDKEWHGRTIKRGSFVTSIRHLSDEIGLTIQQTRTALERLTSTHEITRKSTAKYSIITIVSYADYQDVDTQTNKQITHKQHRKQQSNNKQITTTKEKKEVYVSPTEIHIREEGKKTASPVAAEGGTVSPEKIVSVAEIKKFAATVTGGDDYIACDFRRAFIRSKTKFPDDWKDIFTRFAAADKTSQSEFLDNLQSGVYREKWGKAE